MRERLQGAMPPAKRVQDRHLPAQAQTRPPTAAQVVDDKGASAEGQSDLLNAFNVATFKGDDDEPAFWDRLIPAGERVKDEAEEPEELGLRATRMRGFQEVCGSCACLWVFHFPVVWDLRPLSMKRQAQNAVVGEGRSLQLIMRT